MTDTVEPLANLIQAVEFGSVEQVAQMLKDGAEVNEVNEQGRTALSEAAFFGQHTVVQLLLEQGANPHIADIRGNTSLHAAVSFLPEANCIALITRSGVNVEARNEDNLTPLVLGLGHCLAHGGRYPDAVEALVQCGADLQATNEHGQTAADLITLNATVFNDETVEAAARSATPSIHPRSPRM